MKYSLKNILTHEPVVLGSSLVAVLNLLVLLQLISLSIEQVTGANVAFVLVIGLFTRKAVTPNAHVPEPELGPEADVYDLFG